MEVIDRKPHVILANGPLAVASLKQITSTIPIVFVNVADPVGSGFVAGLARPGGNITGFTLGEFTMSGKMPEILKKIAPHVARVTVIYNPQQVPQVGRLAAVQTAAATFGLQVSAASTVSAEEIKQAIEKLEGEPDRGVIVLPAPVTITNRNLIIALLARYRLPAVYEFPVFARDGGLVSYGTDRVVQFRQAAAYVDRILKGEKPADLPIQDPTKFALIVNLRTAKALGLTVPESLLATADEVIELGGASSSRLLAALQHGRLRLTRSNRTFRRSGCLSLEHLIRNLFGRHSEKPCATLAMWKGGISSLNIARLKATEVG
jgi:putative ABC transport system substrate-binding protein